MILSEKYQHRIKLLMKLTLLRNGWSILLLLLNLPSIHYRGFTFHESLKIGELCSLYLIILQYIMALAATADCILRTECQLIIRMKSPLSIVLPPCKSNITYEVLDYHSIEKNFMHIADGLRFLYGVPKNNYLL